MEILKNMEEFRGKQLMTGDRILIKDLKRKIHIFQSYIKITNLENAEAKGKEVEIYTFETDKFIFSKIENIQEIKTCNILIKKIKEQGFKLITEHEKGIKVFNPFKDFTEKKVIEKIVSKDRITKNDIIKLLRAENAKVKCIEQLTDDYRYDNANNFFENINIPVTRMIETVIESNHFTFFKKSLNEFTLFSNFESYKLLLVEKEK